MEIVPIILISLILILLAYVAGNAIGSAKTHYKWEKTILPSRLKTSKAVIGGQAVEQIAPFFPNFPFNASDCRFVGKPIDFIVFVGSSDKLITEVVFVEVKTGKSSLSTQERHLRDAIRDKRVRWEEWRA